MKIQIKLFFIISTSLITLASCATIPKGQPSDNSKVIDYGVLHNWAAHPDKSDMADLIPQELLKVSQEDLTADVFFVHPTTYIGKPIDDRWNAPINDENLNDRTDASTIQFQASIFNKAGRIFAPRYRQAHILTYFEENKKIAKRVFDIAYADVKEAFQYYLKYHNQGRPFIIASHSQGTTHSTRLIKELVDNKDLEKQMIAAYLIGMPVPKDIFTSIDPCADANDTGCFISWRTYKRGYVPKDSPLGEKITVHNPLSWKMNEEYISKDLNQGAILRDFDKIYTKATDAQIENGMLWAAKPKFPFSFLFTRKNYHVADLNFYYMNVRINAVERVKSYGIGR